MYLDISFRKIGVLLFVFFAMLWSVLLTFDLKDKRYGSTPPFASGVIFLQEIMLRVEYAIEGAVLRSSQLAAATFSFVGGATNSEHPARAIPILTYHRIVWNSGDTSNVSVRNFRDQMYALKRSGWETITLKEYKDFMARKIELPERSVLITFDDGAKESFYPVDPLFRALQFEGVIFVIASAMYTPESTYYLASEEIHRLLDSGRWEIGSHSFDGHRPYAADAAGSEAIFFADKLWLPQQRLETEGEFRARVRNDVQKARETLEREFGVGVDSFAFPLGNETGIEGAANFPEGASITEKVASEFYRLGFLQTSSRDYSFNYPGESDFLAWRIHVHHDWNGARLLQELEGGLPKDLPFNDDFSDDHGWITAWGEVDRGRNNLSLRALRGASSASLFLDGSNLWEDYSFDVSMDWQSSHVFLLTDVKDSKTYNACVYSPGVVRLQTVRNGEVTTLAEKKDERITYGADARAGVRARGYVIECLWNYESIVEAYSRELRGGIGIQTWDSELGKASLRVSEVLARPLMNN